MNRTASGPTRLVTAMRWLARIIGTLSVAVFLFLFVGDCLEKGRIAVESDRVFMTVCLFLAFIGLIIAWRWEGFGGATALLGMLGFNLLAPASVVGAGTLAVTGIFGLPALLFVYCSWQPWNQLDANVI